MCRHISAVENEPHRKKYYPPEGFAQRLYEVWLVSGMTQMEVSRRIRWDRKSVSAWLMGDIAPNILALARLCRLFHVSADYLLFGEEDKDGGQKGDRDAAKTSAAGNQSRRGY